MVVGAAAMHHYEQKEMEQYQQQAAYDQQAAYEQGMAAGQAAATQAAPPPAAPAPAAPAPAPAPAAPAPTADPMDAKIEQLQKLASLKDAGVLTEEEFQAQKQQILAS
jgi:hypothetical protein